MSQNQPESIPQPEALPPQVQADFRALLKGWLDREEERQTLIQRLFSNRESKGKIQELLDENDRRLQALMIATRQLLRKSEF